MIDKIRTFVLGLAAPVTATLIGAYLVQQYMPPRIVTVAAPLPPPPAMMLSPSEMTNFVMPAVSAPVQPAAATPAQPVARKTTARASVAPQSTAWVEPPPPAPEPINRAVVGISPSHPARVEETMRSPPAPVVPPTSVSPQVPAAPSQPMAIVPSSEKTDDPLQVSEADRARLAEVPRTETPLGAERAAESHRPSLLGQIVDTVTSVLPELPR